MSGLAFFLRDHLAVAGNDNNNNGEGEGGQYNYDTSLQSILQNNRPTTTKEEGDEPAAAAAPDNSNSSNHPRMHSWIHYNNHVELDYDLCRKMRQEFLEHYLYKRLLVRGDENDNDEEENTPSQDAQEEETPEMSPALLQPELVDKEEKEETHPGGKQTSIRPENEEEEEDDDDRLETQPLLDDDDPETMEETQKFETRPPLDYDDHQPMNGGGAAPSVPPFRKAAAAGPTPSSKKNQKDEEEEEEDEKNSTPHVSVTLHNVEYAADVDLMTRQLTLLICQVGKIWPCRDTKRGGRRTFERRVQPLYTQQLQLVRLAMDYLQDDGPLSPCYREVLSMEVQQFNTSRLRQHAESLATTTTTTAVTTAAGLQPGPNNNTCSSSRRLRVPVFFYKTYAKAMQKLLEKCQADCTAVVSFCNVPAKCIVPNPATDWLDRHDMAEYCLCIGDDSQITVTTITTEDVVVETEDNNSTAAGGGRMVQHEEEEAYPARFDAKDMTLYVAFAKDITKGIFKQIYSLTPDPACGVVIRELDHHHKKNHNPFAEYYESMAREQETLAKTTTTTRNRNPRLVCNGNDNRRRPTPDDGSSGKASVAQPADAGEKEDSGEASSVAAASAAAASSSSSTNRRKENNQNARASQPETTTTAAAAAAASRRRRPSSSSSPGRKRRRTTTTKERQQPPKNGRNSNGAAAAASPPRNGQHHSATRSRAPSETISYEKMGDLQDIHEHHQAVSIASTEPNACIVSLHGVVIGFSPPFQTKRGDWMVGVALADDTCPLAAEIASAVEFVYSININIFTKEKESLPKILYAGDVLRMHRVKLQTWNNELQLLGMRASSYVVFRGNVHDPGSTTEWTILPTAKRTDHPITDDEQKDMQALWTWGQKRLLSHPTMKPAQRFQLSDIRPSLDQPELYGDPTTGDLTVMVSAIIPVPTQQRTSLTPCGFLRVWDGTGAPTSDPYPMPGGPTTCPDAATSDGDGDPPSGALVKLAKTVKKLQFIKQNPDLQPPKALAGRVLNVAIWEKAHWELVHQAVSVGSFIRLRNIRDEVMPNCGLRCLMVHPKSSLTPLPNLTYEVVQLLENHNSRMIRNDPHNPSSGLLPLHWEQSSGGDTTTTTGRGGDDDTPTGAAAAAATPAPAVGDSSTRREAEAPPAAPPAGCNRLEALVAAPVNTSFCGSVRVVALIPSMRTLSARGLEIIMTTASSSSPPDDTSGGQLQQQQAQYMYSFGVRLQDASGGQVDAIVHDGFNRQMLNEGRSDTTAPSGSTANSHNNSSNHKKRKTAGHVLVGMSADAARQNSSGALYNLHRLIEERESLDASIASMEYHGGKYFVLESLSSHQRR